MTDRFDIETDPDIDISKRYIRLIEERDNGFVEFEFAIGEPELFVELVLPRAAFEEFSKEHEAIQLPPRMPSDSDFASDAFRVSWLKGGGLDAIFKNSKSGD